jgi:Mce-associated membrane protein
VLLFVNTVATSVRPGQRSPRQQISQGRARLVLVTEGDAWRVARLSTLLGDTPAVWGRR